jgi:hypothetical protein
MSIFTPTVSWEAIISETTPHATSYNYTCRVSKVNANDPGYGTLAVGYYIVDFIGHLFEIMEINYGGDATVVRVYDILEDDNSYGPYNDKGSYVYSSLYDAALLAQAKLNRLDESAEDFVRSLGLSDRNTYLGLLDTTDTTFTSQAEKLIHVNSGETALEFISDVKVDSIDEYTTDAGIDLGSGLIFVDKANSRIGINETSPTVPFHINVGAFNTGVLYESTDDGLFITLKTPSQEWIFGQDTGEDFIIRDVTSGTVDVIQLFNGAPSNSLWIDGSGVVSMVGSLSVDTINEFTADNGLTIDSVIIKDGRVTNSSDAAPTVDAELANKKYVDDNTLSSPLTTKGDLYTYSSVDARLPVGTNGQILSADSTETTGLKWINAPSGTVSFGTDNQIPFTNSGGTDFDYSAAFTWDGTRLLLDNGYDNIIIGNTAGNSITSSALQNVIIGDVAAYNLTGGDYNVLIGRRAAYTQSTANGNVIIGERAGYSNETGNYNVCLGIQSGYFNTGGSNTYIGSYSGINRTSASENTFLGRDSGGAVSSANGGNVFLGYQSGYYETGADKLFIDNQSRNNEATARTNSLIYGIFDATVANQELHLNAGVIMIDDIPTSDPSNTGQIWNDSGTLKVSA